MRHYTTNENHGEDILKAIAKIEALENNFKYSQKEKNGVEKNGKWLGLCIGA